jgi:O-antigen/teichoic acid export membrane protein
MDETPKKTTPDISGSWGGHLRNGAFWMIALRWAIRLTGLVSTVILARLLSPRDFGIVAMAMIVVGTLEIFNQTGQVLVLIRLENPTKAHYNSAWTVSFLIGLFIAVVILLIAPFTVAYFHEPRVIPVMQCLAFRALVGGIENVGTIDFRRDLNFNRFFAYNVYPKLIAFVVTISAAIAWRNYWALVAGILTGEAARVVLSYTMHPHRPRFTLAEVSGIWSFSIWTFIRTIGGFLHTQIDQIAVGGISGSAAMGRYAVASDVAASPSREINEPMLSVLYPVMSRLQHDKAALRDVFLRTLGWSAIICISTSVGVAMVAEDMSNLVLGPKWAGIGPLMSWLSIGAGIIGLSSGAYPLFDALGLPHIGARMIWIRLLILGAVVVPVAFLTRSLMDVAIVRAIASAVFIPGLYFAVSRLTGISFGDYIRCLWRPFAAAAVMAAMIFVLNIWVSSPGPVRLFADVFTGVAVFNIVVLGLWMLSGRPTGPEMDVLATLRRFVPASLGRASAS